MFRKRKRNFEQTLLKTSLQDDPQQLAAETNEFISIPNDIAENFWNNESANERISIPADESFDAEAERLPQGLENKTGGDDLTSCLLNINAVLAEKLYERSTENLCLEKRVTEGVLAGVKSVKELNAQANEIARLHEVIKVKDNEQAVSRKWLIAKDNQINRHRKKLKTTKKQLTRTEKKLKEKKSQLAASASSLRFKNQKIRALQKNLKQRETDFEQVLAAKDKQLQAQAEKQQEIVREMALIKMELNKILVQSPSIQVQNTTGKENDSQLENAVSSSNVTTTTLSPRTFMLWQPDPEHVHKNTRSVDEFSSTPRKGRDI